MNPAVKDGEVFLRDIKKCFENRLYCSNDEEVQTGEKTSRASPSSTDGVNLAQVHESQVSSCESKAAQAELCSFVLRNLLNKYFIVFEFSRAYSLAPNG